MKKLRPAVLPLVEIFAYFALFMLVLWMAGQAHAQQLDSTQIKKKTNGGIAGDSVEAAMVAVYRAATAPSSPVAGQLWCDTSYTPCLLRMYSGSAWIAPPFGATVPTQTSAASFPGSPVDGQIFFSVAPRVLWVYSSTLSKWVAFPTSFNIVGPSVADDYSAEVLSPPGAPTVAASNTAGSLSAGNYRYAITCRTASGGETTHGTPSDIVAPGASKSTDLSNIPTCPTGGTQRNVYRTKANVTGPNAYYFFVANIADNTTTTLNDGVADSSAVLIGPLVNHSAPLPSGWTVYNGTANQGTGGCGGTGSTRKTLACYGGQSGLIENRITSSDPNLRIYRPLRDYENGNLTAQYRVRLMSWDGDELAGGTSAAFAGARVGTDDAGPKMALYVGGGNGCGSTGIVTMPFGAGGNGSSNGAFVQSYRTTYWAGSTCNSIFNPYPQINGFPFYVKFVKRGNVTLWYYSSNGTDWTPRWARGFTSTSDWGNTDGVIASGTTWAKNLYIEIPFGTTAYVTQANGGWIEIDNFTIVPY